MTKRKWWPFARVSKGDGNNCLVEAAININNVTHVQQILDANDSMKERGWTRVFFTGGTSVTVWGNFEQAMAEIVTQVQPTAETKAEEE